VVNQTDPPTETARQTVSHSGTDARLSRQWFILARVAWFVLVLVTLSLFVATLPIYFTHLQTPCLTPPCSFGQLTPDAAQALSESGFSLSNYALFVIIFSVILALVCLAIAALLLWRKSDNWMAFLVAFWLVMLGTNTGTMGVGELSTLLGQALASILNDCFNFLGSVCVILIFCLFPNGRFVPRWTRWLAVFTFLIALLPFFIPPAPSTALDTLGGVLWISLVICGLVAQLYRYWRVSTRVERQRTKWVVFTFAFGGIIVIGLTLPEAIFPSLRYGSLYDIVGNVIPSFCLNLLIALAFGIAILRYRLYDIDILIRRTLIYGTLTALLALVYFGLVIGLQALLHWITGQVSQSPVAIVASTLAIAALFQPLRRRIQSIIDRRFYRRKYDAAKTLEAFSATLRSEVDLNQLREHLVGVVEETMQPTFVSLWLRPPEHDEKRKPWRANPPVSSEER
jgi:hypothetical protein